MAAEKQLSVTMENAPGVLAKLCSAFSQRKINILAFTSSEQQGKSLVRVIVDRLPAAKTTLQAIGYTYAEEEVLGVRLPNRPGTLARVAKALGDAGININYAYSGVEAGTSHSLVVLSVSDFGKARKLIK